MPSARKNILSADFVLLGILLSPLANANAENTSPRTMTQSDGSITASAPSSTNSIDAEDRLTMFGLLIDGGLPDGLGASLVFRPLLYTRLDAGVTYNLVGYGVRGGITLVPFRWAIVPTLRLEAGHYFEGDASRLTDSFGETSEAVKMVLRRMYYNYASAQIGLEIGSQNRFVFFLRGGISYISTSLRDFQSAVRTETDDSSVEIDDPIIRGTIPSANVGFMVFFY